MEGNKVAAHLKNKKKSNMSAKQASQNKMKLSEVNMDLKVRKAVEKNLKYFALRSDCYIFEKKEKRSG